jgi:regulator of cell morphogenesis and NO signaling
VQELAREHSAGSDPFLGVIRNLQSSYQSLESVLVGLKSEHVVTGQELAQLREFGDGFAVPVDGCASYRRLMVGLAELESDLHLHIHKENNILFPKLLKKGNL